MRKRKSIEVDCEIHVTESRLALWPELLWMTEWAELRMSPIFHGTGLPHGDDQPVIVVPGFLGSDAHTAEMRGWLKRLGYATYPSGIGRNVDCPDVSLERLEETLESVVKSSGQRVRLVGHSLGGLLCRAVAVRRPDLVSQIVTIGSPVGGLRAHPLIVWVARLLGGVTPSPTVSPRVHGDHAHDGTCACELTAALVRPLPEAVESTSLYSRRDGIVDWRACVDAAPGRNVQVGASHLGMLVNKDVYTAVAKAMAASAVNTGAPARKAVASVEKAA